MNTCTIEKVEVDVDLDKPVPCEHPEHGRSRTRIHKGPGALIVQMLPCPNCGTKPREQFICCLAAYVGSMSTGLTCRACNTVVPRDSVWLLIREL